MRRRNEGFILADTLIALTVLSASLLTIMTMAINSQRLASTSSETLASTLLAKSILESEAISSTGQLTFQGEEYQWTKRSQVRPGQVEDRIAVEDMYVTLNWGTATEPKSKTLSKTILRPVNAE